MTACIPACAGEAGPALLKADGYPDARPCHLTAAVAISHALAMLDVHLAARQAGLAAVRCSR